MRRPRLVLAAALTGMLLTACSDSGEDALEAAGAGSSTIPEAVPATPTPTAEPTEASVAVDPASVGANELGRIPVMMYHQVKADPRGRFDQSPAEFGKELERLYDEDYRPITVAALVNGLIDVPAGKRPVVLTFDDSTISQAQIGADGEPTPDSALGILEAFGQKYADFEPTATFYVNNGSFADPKVVPWLIENGYEVGAHTASHVNLSELSDAAVQEEIATNVREIEAAVPGYTVTTFARPLGIAPQNKDLQFRGSYEGDTYDLAAAMLVGAEPAASPFSAAFDPQGVRRILSGLGDVDFDSNYWLDQLQESSSVYVSDGNPDTIAYPSTSTAKIADDWKAKAISYDPSGASTESSTGSVTPTPASTPAAVQPSGTATP